MNKKAAKKPSTKKPSTKKAAADVESRLSVLEAEVASLRAALTAQRASSDQAQEAGATRDSAGELVRHWAFEPLQQRHPDSGGVMFAGHITLPTEETYAWQVEWQTNHLLEADWSAAQLPLTALAHPIRLLILRAILDGKRDSQSLQALPDMGTTGQLYHHLKELEAAGWIRQPRRGQYNLLAERVVPLLVILAACEVSEKRV